MSFPESLRRLFGGFSPNENVSRKFEPGAQFPYLFQSKTALSSHEHRNRALRTKLRDKVALCQILLLDEKSHN
jgi:hypothetical protein